MRTTSRLLCALALLLAFTATAEAARVRVVKRPHSTTVTVHRGFPIHRTLPRVVVRPPAVAVRVAPRVYLAPVVFGGVVVHTAPAVEAQSWHDDEDLSRGDGWTDFTMNVDATGSRLLLQIDHGPAQVSFVEVVFENGETRVVDFADGVHRQGLYEVIDFAGERRVDHLRVVGKASGEHTELVLRLVR
jgi:hypothetical protein